MQTFKFVNQWETSSLFCVYIGYSDTQRKTRKASFSESCSQIVWIMENEMVMVKH